MACGTPVITSDAGGIPEVVGPDGQAGLIFRTGSVDDLERQMRVLLADPTLRARMGQAARDRIELAFSIDRMVDGYMQLLLSL